MESDVLNLAPPAGNSRSPSDIQGSEAPAARNASHLDIILQAHKRNEYDRGIKKVIVDGWHWGWIKTISHGSQGPTYHLEDLHGAVTKPRKIALSGGRSNGETEVTLRLPRERDFRISNIGKPEAEQKHRPKTDVALTEMVRDAIANGWLRHPDIRDKEIAAAHERYRQSVEASEAREVAAFEARADTILDQMNVVPGLRDLGRRMIVDAMKWAQTQ